MPNLDLAAARRNQRDIASQMENVAASIRILDDVRACIDGTARRADLLPADPDARGSIDAATVAALQTCAAAGAASAIDDLEQIARDIESSAEELASVIRAQTLAARQHSPAAVAAALAGGAPLT